MRLLFITLAIIFPLTNQTVNAAEKPSNPSCPYNNQKPLEEATPATEIIYINYKLKEQDNHVQILLINDKNEIVLRKRITEDYQGVDVKTLDRGVYKCTIISNTKTVKETRFVLQ